MDINTTINTRIALRYDTYNNWTDLNSTPGFGKNLVLLKGELGVCAIPEGHTGITSIVAPTVLFKVGDGEKPFEQLPWASANAADVYEWAKASDVELVTEGEGDIKTKAIKFTGTDKVITLDYLTEAEVKAIIGEITSDVSDIQGRLDKIEAFFYAADFDGEDKEGSLYDTLDTLVEIQDYLKGDGSGTGSLLSRVAANETAITVLQDIVKDGGTLEARVDSVEADIADIFDIVSNGNNANSKLGEAIASIQSIVSTGDNSNANLRSAISSLQELTGDNTNNTGNIKLREDLNTLTSIVTADNTGLVTTVTANAGKIAEIEADYLKQSDDYILECGSSIKTL